MENGAVENSAGLLLPPLTRNAQQHIKSLEQTVGGKRGAVKANDDKIKKTPGIISYGYVTQSLEDFAWRHAPHSTPVQGVEWCGRWAVCTVFHSCAKSGIYVVDEVTKHSTFHSLEHPKVLPSHKFIAWWLNHHSAPLCVRHFHGLGRHAPHSTPVQGVEWWWNMGGMHPIPLLCKKWNGVERGTACRWTRYTCTGTSGNKSTTR